MNETSASPYAYRRNVEREAREFLDYRLQPFHKLVTLLEDGDVPTFSPRLLMPSPVELAQADPELLAAVDRLRRTLWYRLRFAWAQLRNRRRFPA